MADLEDLQTRIKKARSDGVGDKAVIEENTENDSQGSHTGLRAIADLIGTPVVCGAIGIGLDKWLGTSPFGFIILAFLGVLAGFWNLYKMSEGSGSEVGFKQLQTREKEGKKSQLFRDKQ